MLKDFSFPPPLSNPPDILLRNCEHKEDMPVVGVPKTKAGP